MPRILYLTAMPQFSWSHKQPPQAQVVPLHPLGVLYPQGSGYPPAQPARGNLYYGDNLALMAALLPEWRERFAVIYADPPFFTNRNFAARLGKDEDSRHPQNWLLTEGYRDSWRTLDEYLQFLYERLTLMHQLLAPTGTLYLHLDWHANAYARLILDEIFGADRLLNELVWLYHGPSPIRSAFNRKHDTILVYTKSEQYTFNVDEVRVPYNEGTIKTFKSSAKAGFGKVPDLARGKVPEDWWYFPVVARLHNERTGYPTQKPEALLERMLRASSNAEDWVGDFFCGSGTTLKVAAGLGRQFVGCDAGWRALVTAQARLALQANASPVGLARVGGAAVPQGRELPAGAVRAASPRVVALGAEIALSEVDFWEVDPHWDGSMFHSVMQSARTRKAPQVAAQLTLGVDLGNAAVRVTWLDGAQSVVRVTG
ncbi:MAG: hypothetical protein OHK0052_08140 [Anaerolineales bacterium]